MLHPGLYEQVINNALNRELSEVPEACKSTAPIDTAEASKVLAQYLTEVVQKGLDNVQDNGGGIEAQIELANQSSFLRFYGKMTHALPPEKLPRTSSGRKRPLRKAHCLPGPSTSRRCTPS